MAEQVEQTQASSDAAPPGVMLLRWSLVALPVLVWLGKLLWNSPATVLQLLLGAGGLCLLGLVPLLSLLGWARLMDALCDDNNPKKRSTRLVERFTEAQNENSQRHWRMARARSRSLRRNAQGDDLLDRSSGRSHGRNKGKQKDHRATRRRSGLDIIFTPTSKRNRSESSEGIEEAQLDVQSGDFERAREERERSVQSQGLDHDEGFGPGVGTSQGAGQGLGLGLGAPIDSLDDPSVSPGANLAVGQGLQLSQHWYDDPRYHTLGPDCMFRPGYSPEDDADLLPPSPALSSPSPDVNRGLGHQSAFVPYGADNSRSRSCSMPGGPFLGGASTPNSGPCRPVLGAMPDSPTSMPSSPSPIRPLTPSPSSPWQHIPRRPQPPGSYSFSYLDPEHEGLVQEVVWGPSHGHPEADAVDAWERLREEVPPEVFQAIVDEVYRTFDPHNREHQSRPESYSGPASFGDYEAGHNYPRGSYAL